MTYPKDSELVEHELSIRNTLFHKYLTPEVNEAAQMLVACLDKATPYADLLALHTEQIKVTDDIRREAYPQWDIMPEQLRNKIRRAGKKAEEIDTRGLYQLLEVINSQARHTSNWDDKMIDKIERLHEAI